MGSVEIPKWVGPAVTPIVLILLVVILCWYYCYWKPRKQRKMQDNAASDTEKNTKTANVHSAPSKQRSPYYLHHSYPVDNSSYTTCYSIPSLYGQFYPEICPLPMSNRLNYCMPQEHLPPKVFCYPKNPARDVNSRRTVVTRSECQDIKIKKCKVKCMKCPNLPIIMEGDSIVEDEEDQNSKVLGSGKLVCRCDESSAKVVNESENISETNQDSSNPNNDHDSGYED